LYLSDDKIATIDRNDIYFIHVASERSVEIYDEYQNSLIEHNVNDEDLEDMFTSLLESRKSIKH